MEEEVEEEEGGGGATVDIGRWLLFLLSFHFTLHTVGDALSFPLE